jgi:hypothetical protein
MVAGPHHIVETVQKLPLALACVLLLPDKQCVHRAVH